jgi:hypothetical protein
LDRRQFLAAAGATGLGSLAGCTGNAETDQPEEETPDDVPEALQLNGKNMNPTFPMKYVDTDTGDILAEAHWHRGEPGHWHRQPIELPVDQWRALRFEAVDLEREPIPFGDDQPYQIVISRSEQTPADLLELTVAGDIVSLRGLTTGTGELYTEIRHDGERVFLSLPMGVKVV